MSAEEKQKGKRGGPRKGAGRKPIAREVKVLDVIQRAFNYGPDSDYDEEVEIWRTVIDKAMKGSDKHVTLLFNYRYGKPKETIDLGGTGMKLEIVSKIVRE